MFQRKFCIQLLVEIEELLNSKPLSYVSSNISDLDPITLNILLMGRRDASLSQVMNADSELLACRKWRHSQVLADRFWASFIEDYLPNLQIRQKWKLDSNPIVPYTKVIIIDPQLPRGRWPVGTISKTLLISDGTIRVAEIFSEGKHFIRPVSHLIVLPELTNDGDNIVYIYIFYMQIS